MFVCVFVVSSEAEVCECLHVLPTSHMCIMRHAHRALTKAVEIIEGITDDRNACFQCHSYLHTYASLPPTHHRALTKAVEIVEGITDDRNARRNAKGQPLLQDSTSWAVGEDGKVICFLFGLNLALCTLNSYWK